MRFAVAAAGGRAIKITTRAPRDPKSVDGLIFGGGADVFPKRYAGEPKQGYRYDLARDDWRPRGRKPRSRMTFLSLASAAGMQMLNVLGGGTLFRRPARFQAPQLSRNFSAEDLLRLPIRIAPASWLAEAAQCPELCVNSIHSQAVDSSASDFTHGVGYGRPCPGDRTHAIDVFARVSSSTPNFSSIAASRAGFLEASSRRASIRPRKGAPRICQCAGQCFGE